MTSLLPGKGSQTEFIKRLIRGARNSRVIYERAGWVDGVGAGAGLKGVEGGGAMGEG